MSLKECSTSDPAAIGRPASSGNSLDGKSRDPSDTTSVTISHLGM
jgi:hypothetical protein